VGRVDHHGRATGDQLDAGGPCQPGQALTHRRLGDHPAQPGQAPQGGQRHGRVRPLMPPQQRHGHAVVRPHVVQVPIAKVDRAHGRRRLQAPRRAIEELEVNPQLRQPATALLARLSDDFPRAGLGNAAHDRHARLDDARLLPGNGFQGVAQLLRVVETDARDYRDSRAADVRGVQPASQPHLEHRQVYLGFGKVQEGHGRDNLEIRGPGLGWKALGAGCVHGLDHRPEPLQQAHELGGRTGPAVDRDPFLRAVQVGRSEQPGAVSRRREHGRDHGCRGTLALGARHVDDRHAEVRVANPRQQLPHPVEVELRGPQAELESPLVIRALAEEAQGSFHRGGFGDGRRHITHDHSPIGAFRRRMRHISPTRQPGQLVVTPSLALRAGVWPRVIRISHGAGRREGRVGGAVPSLPGPWHAVVGNEGGAVLPA